jgi:hypothetical protein
MRLEFRCWKCADGTPGSRVTAPFNESGAYSFQCARGHVHNIVLMQSRFEILAETGMQAINDGYYREAVTSFAASLERIFQYYIEVVTHAAGIEKTVSDRSWKHVAAQSERQLGMYIGLYQLDNKAVAPLLSQKQVGFRNRVVHQGYIPTKDEAIDFAQAVVDLAQPLLNAMIPRYTASIEALVMARAAGTSLKNGVQSLVFYDFVLRFDTEAEDWNPPAANIRRELAARRADALDSRREI